MHWVKVCGDHPQTNTFITLISNVIIILITIKLCIIFFKIIFGIEIIWKKNVDKVEASHLKN